jgi:hypothetical protein
LAHLVHLRLVWPTVTLHGFSAQGVSNANACEEQRIRTAQVAVDGQNAAIADEHSRAALLAGSDGSHCDALAWVLLCWRECLENLYAYGREVLVLREESEEQAKSMLLPLLTSVQNLLVTWLPCKHQTT